MLHALFKIFLKYYLEKLQVIQASLTAPVMYINFAAVHYRME